jgi:hypothetical protein
MSKRTFRVILLVLLNTTAAKAQLSIKGKQSEYFLLPGLHIVLSNNFIRDGYKYTPNYISLPFKEEHFKVYGGQLIMSAFKKDSLVKTGDYSGAFFIDSSWQDRNAFPLEAIQVRVSRNDTLLRDWRPLNRLPDFEDSAVTFKADPGKPVRSYWLVRDSLRIGDSLLVELRKDTGQAFFRLYAKRENAYTQPHLMTYYSDTSLTEFSFIRKILLDHRQKIYDELSYDDWPGPGLPLYNSPISANARLAFYFRKDIQGSKDSIFAYRVLGGRYTDTSWQKTDGLILVPALQSNASYKMEVKYADGHGTVSAYSFYTPPLWYQATSFRIIVVMLVIATLLLLGFLSRAGKNKRRMKQLQLEMQALHAQMNPHFLFNALGSIQGLMNDMQTAKANKYLSGFAALLRSSISQGQQAFVPLPVELKNLDNYIELERLRFGFQYVCSVSPGIRSGEIAVPPLLAQPLIENAAKHGLSGKQGAGMLRLEITAENADMLMIVTDNGKGFDTMERVTGHGIALTRDRIALFNRMYKHRQIILTINSTAGGTQCILRFKNWMDK